MHPITIPTLPDKDNNRVAYKVLIDQCSTDNGLISWELVNALNIPTFTGITKTFITAAGAFATNKITELSNTCSIEVNYSTFIGQESMQKLDLKTSICDNAIYWDDKQTPMSHMIIGLRTKSSSKKTVKYATSLI